VDFLHYISVTEDPRYSSRYKKFNKMLFDGLIDKLMPELGRVLDSETIPRSYGLEKSTTKSYL